MARNKKTYLVNRTSRAGVTETFTLLDWCSMVGISYDTIVSRIWKAEPSIVGGVIFFNEEDPILEVLEPRGAPAHGANAPCVRPERQWKEGKRYNIHPTGRVSKKHRLK